ncbi:hypothetical protein NDU88_000677 [Pleurodeles waltl]|uniref:Uncharacterized protein n=1 Tax=Pleurodeles waltl TaxID=8319 RepID=A0AAV7US00_PLEWA|nr:hypothetical protein NDU88_000677 [Pleurodeles waltl]
MSVGDEWEEEVKEAVAVVVGGCCADDDVVGVVLSMGRCKLTLNGWDIVPDEESTRGEESTGGEALSTPEAQEQPSPRSTNNIKVMETSRGGAGTSEDAASGLTDEEATHVIPTEEEWKVPGAAAEEGA